MPSRRESKEGRGEEAKPLKPDSHSDLNGRQDFSIRNHKSITRFIHLVFSALGINL